MGKASEEFHKHLDECKRCENNPFDLCRIGMQLIEQVREELEEHSRTGFQLFGLKDKTRG